MMGFANISQSRHSLINYQSINEFQKIGTNQNGKIPIFVQTGFATALVFFDKKTEFYNGKFLHLGMGMVEKFIEKYQKAHPYVIIRRIMHYSSNNA